MAPVPEEKAVFKLQQKTSFQSLLSPKSKKVYEIE